MWTSLPLQMNLFLKGSLRRLYAGKGSIDMKHVDFLMDKTYIWSGSLRMIYGLKANIFETCLLCILKFLDCFVFNMNYSKVPWLFMFLFQQVCFVMYNWNVILWTLTRKTELLRGGGCWCLDSESDFNI